jgi:aminoglycoside 3-N-acetyltransferase I
LSAIVRLGPADLDRVRALNSMFGKAFEDPDSYAKAPPSDAYVQRILARNEVIALAAIEDDEVIGGLVAYVLPKLEQERSEIYIYDLAVAENHRRKGLASALIGELQRLAAKLGAWVIYVQADHGDDPAIALYTKLGRREDVMHFDIAPRATT